MHKLIIFIGGILVGFGLAWMAAVIQNEYKLYRDHVIQSLIADNKKYKRIVDRYEESSGIR